MPVLISGILRDGAGKPVQGCTIHLKAKRTSPTVVVEIISSDITGPDGSYRIEAEPGYYSVSLLREGFPPALAGDIYVAPTDAPDTLNAFLDAPKDGDLRPEVMKRFEEMVNRTAALCQAAEKDRERTEQSAQSAAQSNDAAALSATAAAESQRQAALSADAADVSARSAADNARQTAQDVLVSSANADSASKSAQTATEQAGKAKTAADTAQKAQQGAEAAEQSVAESASHAAVSAQAADDSAGRAAASEGAAHESAQTAIQAAEQSAASAGVCASSEQTATQAAGHAATSEQNAAASAGESAQSAKESAESARLAGQHKDAAALSAQAAKDSEDAAAKSAEDAAVTLAGALKTENNLSEIAGAGNEAVAEAHLHLQLGDAARQGVQSDIYDRTPGIVALPGAFGYGALFSTTQYFSAVSGPAEFLEWVRKTPPGRYNVVQFGNPAGTYNPVITGVNFNGILEIVIPETVTAADQGSRGRLIEFRGVNGDFYKNRLYTTPAPRLIGWENLRPDDALKKLYGRLTGEWGDPDINSLILAVYHGGLSGGEEITLTRGKVISGSRLGPLTIRASIAATGIFAASPQFITTSCNTHPLPGSYVSLSGTPTTRTTDGLVGIFMRIA